MGCCTNAEQLQFFFVFFLRFSASSKLAGTTSEVEQPEQISGIKVFFFRVARRPTTCTFGFTWLWGNDLHLVENVRRTEATEHESLASYLWGGMESPAFECRTQTFVYSPDRGELRGTRRGERNGRTQERHSIHFKCCKPWFWSDTKVNGWRFVFNSFFLIRHNAGDALWLSSREHWQGRLVLARTTVFLRRALRHWTL